jgi:hypothetical protein
MAVAGLLVLAFLTFFAFRPTAILGINEGALHSSVGGSIADDGCTHIRGGVWKCPRMDSEGSSDVTYRVEVDGLGCWNASRSGGYDPEAGPKHLSGCVTIANYLLSS